MITKCALKITICFLAIQTVCSVTWLDLDDRLCLPRDFNFDEEKTFASLAVVPYLNKRPLKDFGLLEVAPENNYRYNEFLSCMWKSRDLQSADGKIDHGMLTKYLGQGIAKHLGESGPAIKLSTVKAAKILEECKDLYGSSDGHRVVRVRNCLIPHIKAFQNM